MYIIGENGNAIIDSQRVERFRVDTKPDAALIVASYGEDRAPRTIARYKDAAEAKDALEDLAQALAGGTALFRMPDSRYYFEETHIKDARTKRKGGS